MKRPNVFDKYYHLYEEWFEKHEDLYQLELEAIRQVIPDGQGCEIGAGTGRFSAPFNIQYGVEPSVEMRKIAMARGLNVIDGVAENLPFDDEKFDFVLMVTTVCFINNIEKAFREASRVLTKEGEIIIGFVDKKSEIGQKYQKKKYKSRFYREATFYSVAELSLLLKKVGFVIKSYKQTLIPGVDDDDFVQDGYGSGSFVVIKAKKTLAH